MTPGWSFVTRTVWLSFSTKRRQNSLNAPSEAPTLSNPHQKYGRWINSTAGKRKHMILVFTAPLNSGQL